MKDWVWNEGGSNGPALEEVLSVRNHPAFPIAFRNSVRSVVHGFRATPFANLLLNDRGKYLLSVFALALHSTLDPADPRSGLTAERLRRLCELAKLCSRGRVLAVISLMRLKGYVRVEASTGDARVKRLIPDRTLIGFHRGRVREQLDRAALIEPSLRALGLDLNDDAVIVGMAYNQVTLFSSGWRQLCYSPGLMQISESSAGILIFANLIFGGLGDDDRTALPRSFDVPLSISGLAKATGVSRKHVLKTLTQAEALGFATRIEKGGDRIVLHEPLIDEAANFIAVTLLQSIRVARMSAERLASQPLLTAAD